MVAEALTNAAELAGVGLSDPGTAASFVFEIDSAEDYAAAVGEGLRKLNGELGGSEHVEELLGGSELLIRVAQMD